MIFSPILRLIGYGYSFFSLMVNLIKRYLFKVNNNDDINQMNVPPIDFPALEWIEPVKDLPAAGRDRETWGALTPFPSLGCSGGKR
ncbi:hypothetical protein ACFL7M_12415 [Thermodesulfobacteriota bacterium]